MITKRHPYFTSAADMAYLTLLLSLCGAGVLVTLTYQHLALKLGFAAAIQATLLAWVRAGDNTDAVHYALKLQLQAAFQVMFGGLCLLLGLVSTRAFAIFHVAPDLDAVLQAIARFSLEFFIATTLVAAWRLHYLLRSGQRISTLASGAHEHLATALGGSPEAVGKRLADYLNRLRLDSAPKQPRSAYGKRPSIRTTAAGYEVRWAFCPCLIRLTVRPAGNGAVIDTRCVRRGGYYRLELFPNPVDALALLGFINTHVLQLIHSEFALLDAVRDQDALRHQALEMQLRVLQAQIEPHFLFNTLANVRHLYRSSVNDGEQMMDHLIQYLRSTMQELRSERSSVAQEFDLVLHYLAIMKVRMGDRLAYTFVQGDDTQDAALPPAMLITLVENAIKHGLRDRDNGQLAISALRDGERLRVTVQDNGPGFSSVGGTGTGLSNIRQRLEAMYGERAWLEVGALQDGGFVATIIVPFTKAA